MLLQFYSKFLHLPKSSQSQAQTPNTQMPVSFPKSSLQRVAGANAVPTCQAEIGLPSNP